MKRNRNSYVPSTEPLLAGEDNDVHAERKRVLSGSTDDTDVVIIKNLVKVYLLSRIIVLCCIKLIYVCWCVFRSTQVI